MKVLIYPHPSLRKKAKTVKQIDGNIRQLARQMLDLMYKEGGVGLAATQVGKPIRLIVVNLSKKPSDEIVLINPQINFSQGKIEEVEGCLSLPGISARVTRYQQIMGEAISLEGRQITFDFRDLLSRIIQHEIDHLDGILFIDRLTESARKEIASQLKTLEEKTKLL